MTSKGCNAVSRRPCVKGISSKEQMSIVFTDTRLTALIDTLGSTIEHLPAAPVELYTLCIYKDLLEPWLSALRRQRTEVSPRPHCRKLSVGKKKWGISVTYVYWECLNRSDSCCIQLMCRDITWWESKTDPGGKLQFVLKFQLLN